MQFSSIVTCIAVFASAAVADIVLVKPIAPHGTAQYQANFGMSPMFGSLDFANVGTIRGLQPFQSVMGAGRNTIMQGSNFGAMYFPH